MLAASALVSATRAGAQTTPMPLRVLRVCSDPNNLPYSNEKQEGFENRIAELVARELNAELRYTWWAQRRGYIRNTIRAGLCDVYIGMPTGLDMLLLTRPYYRSTYAFVTRRGGPRIASFDDGSTIRYERLLTTMPLDRLVAATDLASATTTRMRLRPMRWHIAAS